MLLPTTFHWRYAVTNTDAPSEAEINLATKITLTWDDLLGFLLDRELNILIEDYNYYITVNISPPRRLPPPKWLTDIYVRVGLP